MGFEDLVAKMKKAPVGRSGGNYLEGNGVYEVEILATQKKMGWNKSFTVRDKELFIAEFRIVKSTNPKFEVGSTASWSCLNPTTSDMGMGDVKGFCIAVTGKDPRSVKETDEKAQNQAALLALAAMGEAEAFKALGIPEDFFIGTRVCLETKTIKKKDGSPFTKHIWSPAPDDEEGAAA